MHDYVPEFMGKRKSHAIGRRIAVQEYARRQIANCHSDAVNRRFKIAPRDYYASALTQISEVVDWTISKSTTPFL
jgi:hypothetical protein